MNGFDADTARRVAAALQTDESYVEKDWHLVRALGIISSIAIEGVTPALSGGTSLAAAWQLIRRFSEDIDFKVSVAGDSPKQIADRRRSFRNEVVKRLEGAGFALDGEPLIGNASQFFRVSFHYGPKFQQTTGIRPGLQVEITFSGTHQPPQLRPVQSLIGRALKASPEVPSILCVDPVETAADKLSALAWRTAARDRAAASDDPTIVRHLHDLAALEPMAGGNVHFPPLARALLDVDAKRSGEKAPTGVALLSAMLPKIEGDPLWKGEYDQFVGSVSFGADAERIAYDDAIAACARMVNAVLSEHAQAGNV